MDIKSQISKLNGFKALINDIESQYKNIEYTDNLSRIKEGVNDNCLVVLCRNREIENKELMIIPKSIGNQFINAFSSHYLQELKDEIKASLSFIGCFAGEVKQGFCLAVLSPGTKEKNESINESENIDTTDEPENIDTNSDEIINESEQQQKRKPKKIK